jgi:hypothetical protein
MSEETGQAIERLHKRKRGEVWRNSLLVFTSTATVLMALVLWAFLARDQRAINVYVQEAQETMRVACEAAKDKQLPDEVQRNCEAAKRNELPQVLQSVVDNPDPDDPESQDPERQERESQEPEAQDSELQETELQEPEVQEGEIDDPDPDDPEDQESEVQEGEIQEPEIQEPEEQNSPVCSAGYSQKVFQYYGKNGVDEPGDPGGDDQYWLICVKD